MSAPHAAFRFSSPSRARTPWTRRSTSSACSTRAPSRTPSPSASAEAFEPEDDGSFTERENREDEPTPARYDLNIGQLYSGGLLGERVLELVDDADPLAEVEVRDAETGDCAAS